MTDLAHFIIEKKAGHFDAAEFNDRYEDAVVELIRSKQEGLPARAQEQPRPTNVVNIMDALRKSIAAVGGAEPAPKKSDAKPAEVASTPKPKAASKTRSASEPAQAQPKSVSVSTPTRAKRTK